MTNQEVRFIVFRVMIFAVSLTLLILGCILGPCAVRWGTVKS